MMAGPKPFMVCGISTKWHGPKTYKIPERKLSWTPPGTSFDEQSSGPHRVPMKQTPRPGYLPTVVPKVDRRRPLPKPRPQLASNETTKVQTSLPLRPMSSANRSLPGKTFGARPLPMVARSKEGKVMGRCPESVRSTQGMTAEELPPRPSCVPRIRIYRSSVGAVAALKGNQDAVVKFSTACPYKPGILRQNPCVRVVETSIDKPVVASDCCTGTLTRNRRLTPPPKPITHPHAVEPAFPIAASPRASPGLSPSPSQSWKIVVSVDVKQTKTPMSICGDGILCSMGDAPNPGVAGMPKDSCGFSESESPFSSPALSSSPTVVETPRSLAEPMVGVDALVKISTETREPSTWVSDTFCATTTISPSRNSTTSMAKLAKVVDGSQASSPATLSDNGNRILMTVCGAVQTARAIFLPSRRTSQPATEAASSRAMGISALRIRKVVIPPLDKDAKASKNPTTQMEIEMLRARRQVAGGGAVYSHLDRLGSLTAMAIGTKIATSSPDPPGQV